MTIEEAIDNRHSVRKYKDIPIPQDIREKLDSFVRTCNETSGLHIRIQYDDPEGFDSRLAQYGSFQGVNNYIVLAGNASEDFDLRCGYFGEKIVLFAQQMGLNTCWTALTFNKKKVKEVLADGEKLCMVIALGFGEFEGKPHKGKDISQVVDEEVPDWVAKGIDAALKAPTAMNQQKFAFKMVDGEPHVMVKGLGVHTKVDLGIVAYHFNAVTGKKVKIRK
ncbi:MAG: nitroreductase [Parasporobacterium sp.]|nr:nitroreductase [Parasporobacterium sp.]